MEAKPWWLTMSYYVPKLEIALSVNKYSQMQQRIIRIAYFQRTNESLVKIKDIWKKHNEYLAFIEITFNDIRID